jgi:WD40 repeat protein
MHNSRQRLWTLPIIVLSVCWSAPGQVHTTIPPAIEVQTGQSAPALTSAFSPDGRVFAISSSHLVLLWDWKRHWQLRSLRQHSSDVEALAFSPNGRWLASGDNDGFICVTDVNAGSVTTRFHSNGKIAALAYAPDGSQLFSAGWDHVVWRWNTDDCSGGCEIGKTPEFANSLAVSRNGHWLAVGDTGGNVVVFAPESNEVPLVLSKQSEISGKSVTLSGQVRSLVFSEQQQLAAVDLDGNLFVWSLPSGTLDYAANVDLRLDGVSFLPNRPSLVIGGSEGLFGITELVDTKSWHREVLKQGYRNAQGNPFQCLSVTTDGRWLAASGTRTFIWDLEKTESSAPEVLDDDSPVVSSLAKISPYGSTLALLTGKPTLFSLISPHFLVFPSYEMTNLPTGVMGSAFTSDEKWFVTSALKTKFVRQLKQNCKAGIPLQCSPPISPEMLENANVLALMSATTLTIKAELPIAGISKSVDPQPVLGADGHSLLFLVEGALQRVTILTTGATQADTMPVETSRRVLKFALDGDGQTLALSNRGEPIKLLNFSTGATLATLATGSPEPGWWSSLAFSPVSAACKSLVAGSHHGELHLWDREHGNKEHILSGLNASSRVVYGHTGRLLAAGTEDGSLMISSINSGCRSKEVVIDAHAGSVNDLAFGPEDKWLATVGNDGTVRFWNPSDGKLIASLLFAISGAHYAWLAVTPDGRFDGDPRLFSKVLWRFSPDLWDVMPAESFFNEFYSPGLLEDVLLQKPQPKIRPLMNLDRRLPLVAVNTEPRGGPSAIADRHVKVIVTVDVEENTRAKDVRLFWNGVLIKHWHGLLTKRHTELEADVPVSEGLNDYMAYAFNQDNVRSQSASTGLLGAASLGRQRTLYLLNVGINEYTSTQLRLADAAPDAQALGEEIPKQMKLIPSNIGVVQVSLLNHEASRRNILLALDRLSGKEDQLPTGAPQQLGALKKVEPEDAVIVSFSGHGLASDKVYYLAPSDTILKEKPEASTNLISSKDLESAFEGLVASTEVLIIDACESGQLLEADEGRRGPLNVDGLAQLAYEKGMFVVAASQKRGAALELDALHHGLLTYVLVQEGLVEGKADIAPPDGKILLSEWLRFAEQRVPDLAQLLIAQRNRGFTYLQTDRTRRSVVQKPRVFFRPELEDERSFVIATTHHSNAGAAVAPTP